MTRSTLLVLSLLVIAACGDRVEPRPANVILISIDTLRADALSAYGGVVATPALDRLAREGTLFENASATAPATASSHASLFTGREVLSHGVVKNGTVLPDDLPTLAEVARATGYRTGGFVSSFVLDPRFGWNRGFDHFDAEFPQEGATLPKGANPNMFWTDHDFDGFDRRAPNTTRVARGWLESVPEPFFLFVHYFDPHLPYAPPRVLVEQVERAEFPMSGRSIAGMSTVELTQLVRLYHAEVLLVDEALADLLSALDERALAGETLVVVTSDHGEGLGEHAWFEHAVHLYEELLHVPLIFWWHDRPGYGYRIAEPVSLADVAPTIAELARLPALRGADGRSLAASVEHGSAPDPRPVFAYRRAMKDRAAARRGETHSVRRDQWKYIQTDDGSTELFDLSVDPDETRNLRETSAARLGELASVLERHRAHAGNGVREADPSEDVLEGLRALGYVD